jgi:hypothetical protein
MRHPVTDEQFLLAVDDLRRLGNEFRKLKPGETLKIQNWGTGFQQNFVNHLQIH